MERALVPGAEPVGHLSVQRVQLLITLLPLLLHPPRRLPRLAIALALVLAQQGSVLAQQGSVLVQRAFVHAISSIWCTFSTMLSVLVIRMMREPAVVAVRAD